MSTSSLNPQDVLNSAGEWLTNAKEWVTADRLRLFVAAAVGSVVVTFVCFLVPNWFFSVVLSSVAALMSGVFVLLAVATWYGRRNGSTDTRDVWDQDVSESKPEDVLKGFSAFRD